MEKFVFLAVRTAIKTYKKIPTVIDFRRSVYFKYYHNNS